MTTVLLVRHGRTTANSEGVLAGWTPGVYLDEKGREQATALGERLRDVLIDHVVTSPLERCRETTERVLLPHSPAPTVSIEPDLGEAHYGDWTGRKLSELATEPLWTTVQQHPSAAVFPGEEGEPMAAMAHRAVAAVRRWVSMVQGNEEQPKTLLVVSHGDVLKAILADALGMHLDAFQRIEVAPCSLSVIRYTPHRPFVERLNDTGGSVAALIPRPAPADGVGPGDAVVGGGAGA